MSTDGFNKAYIHGDLSIPPNDEVELKWYVGKGPVAIGICGTDMDFMYYGGRLEMCVSFGFFISESFLSHAAQEEYSTLLAVAPLRITQCC